MNEANAEERTMFRLLVFLSIGRLLLGSRHRRRTLWRGLLAWGMLGFLANHHFDMENMEDEIREKAEDLYAQPGNSVSV